MYLLLILLHLSLVIGPSHQINEECLCKGFISHSATGQDNIPVTIFRAEEYDIKLKIAFKNKDEGEDMDLITVKGESYEIRKTRYREEPKLMSFNLTDPMPMGWVNMNITLSSTDIQISPFIKSITTEFPIREIIITSHYLSSCHQRTPSWNVDKKKPVIVPSIDFSRNRFSISSPKEFSPVLSIMNINSDITLDLQEIIGTFESKLPTNHYNIVIENYNGTTKIIHQGDSFDRQILTVLLPEAIIKNITASTSDESFTLVLESMEVIAEKTLSEEAQVEASSCTVIHIKYGVCLGLPLLLLIIYTINIKIKLNKQTDKKEDVPLTSVIPHSNLTLRKSQGGDNKLRNRYKRADDEQEPLMEENIDQDEIMYEYAKAGNLKMVENYIIGGGINCEHKQGFWGHTSLHAACWEGHLKVADVLIQHKFDINAKDKWGHTPLHASCWGGHLQVAKLLLRKGVEKDVLTSYGYTPLRVVREWGLGDKEAVEIALLDAGAKSEIPQTECKRSCICCKNQKSI